MVHLKAPLLALTVALVVQHSYGVLQSDVVPPEMAECVGTYYSTNNTVNTTPEEVHLNCLHQFMWKTGRIRWSDYNITDDDFAYIRSLSSSVYRGITRTKRQVGGGSMFPPTGFRVRREYRRLTDMERAFYHSAINALKRIGRYDMFGNLHTGIVVNSAHMGPNFLGWHRVFITLYEEALRRIDPRVTLPYWDSTMDHDMENPVNSIIWTPAFLGNGDGFVVTGPFGDWPITPIRLNRNIGSGSRLMRKQDIRRVLTRCRTSEITDPTATPDFNLEILHGGPHNWVGGLMRGLNTAAHDPVFFMHHAFIDYIWELFRIRQARFCGVNPETDYPPSDGLHSATRPMDGLPPYRNIDGYRGFWTQFWFRYERHPTCSRFRPFCGSPYLRCDVARGLCVSVARRVSPGGPEAIGMAFSGAVTSMSASAARARSEEASIPVGPTFRAPPPDERTQDGQRMLMSGRFRRAAPSNFDSGPTFRAPPSDGRTSDVIGKNIAKGVPGLDMHYGNENYFGQSPFTVPDSSSLLPAIDFQNINNNIRPQVKNTFAVNGQVDKSLWVYIPLRVIHQHSSASRNIAVPSRFSPLNGCIQNDSGRIQVKVQSNGLSYAGTYTDYVSIDADLQTDWSTAVVALRSPTNSTSRAMLIGVYGCGQMCQPYCYAPRAPADQKYVPCSGIISITSADASIYSNTYEEAVAKVWQEGQPGYTGGNDQVQVVLHCSLRDTSPWLFQEKSNSTLIW